MPACGRWWRNGGYPFSSPVRRPFLAAAAAQARSHLGLGGPPRHSRARSNLAVSPGPRLPSSPGGGGQTSRQAGAGLKRLMGPAAGSAPAVATTPPPLGLPFFPPCVGKAQSPLGAPTSSLLSWGAGRAILHTPFRFRP